MSDDAEVSSAMARLRHETRPEHEAVERDLDLAGDGLTMDVYRLRVRQLFGFYRPLEARLARHGDWAEVGIDFAARRKEHLLAADLRALGEVVERAPLCEDLPVFEDWPGALGCMYVLEGATLGGQIISRHVRGKLGLTPETGARFFQGYGESSGAMWRAFGAALDAHVTSDAAERAAVLAARSTFRALRRFCAAAGGP